MTFSKKALFIFLWALTPFVSLLAFRYSHYPNQLYWLYKIFLAILVVFIFRDFFKIITVQIKWLALVALYAFSFIVVSYFGVDFSTSIFNYHVLYLPLILFDFFIAFTIGYKYHENSVFKYIVGIGIALAMYAVADIFLTPGKTRLVADLGISMAIPVSVVFGNIFLALMFVLFLFASMKKTIAACGLLSFGLAIWLNWALTLKGRVYVRSVKDTIIEYLAARKILTVSVILTLVALSPPYILRMIERLKYMGSDTTRTAISDYSFDLLQEHFPYGIGLGGFSFLSMDTIPYQIIDGRGVLRTGANLHNSFMTWALEGGALVTLVMIVIFFYLLKIIRRFLLFDETKALGVVLLIWALSGMLFGLFQQWHNSGTFWLLIGYSFGCYERYRLRN